MDAIRELKTRAEILHRRIQANDHHAIGRLRVLPEFRRASYERLATATGTIRRRHCLTVIAAELGFASWPQAKTAISGDDPGVGPGADFGTILYSGHGCAAHLNRWYKTYEEAAADRTESGGYLLAYKRQYLVVDHYFIQSLGLDPADPDWEALGFDWVRPKSVAARSRLYGQLVASLPRAVSAPFPRSV
jgi:hypothetical protein